MAETAFDQSAVDGAMWLRPSDAARAIGISKDVLIYHVRRGRLRAVITPLGRLIARADVERFIAERAARADDAADD